MNWSEPFNYTVGNLTGNDGWIDGSFDPTMQVLVIGLDHAAAWGGAVITQENVNPTCLTGVVWSTPWVFTAHVYFAPVADAGAFPTIRLGGEGSDGISIGFTFNAGDGALNRCSQIELYDGTNADDAINVPFTANTDHTITVTFDGADLVLRVDGTIRATLVGATIGSPDPAVKLRGSVGDVTDFLYLPLLSFTQ